MKSLAVVVGLLIVLLGLVGIVAPGSLVALGLHSVTPVGLYVIAALRVVIGLILLGVASASRLPRTLRVCGIVVLAAGLTTPFLGVERAHAIMTWWVEAGLIFVRLSAMLAVLLGSVIIYAVANRGRAA